MLRRTLIVAAASALFAARAEATVVRAYTLEEKVQASPLIVYGVVERIESEWEEPDASVRTLITFRVEQTLKGEAKAGTKLIVYQGGGQIGDFKQVASGMSKFEPGEEAVLFLEPLGPYVVELGIGIGKYEIGTSGKQKWVTHSPSVAGARIVPGRRMKIEPILPMEPMQLYKFLKYVRSIAQGIPTDPPMPRKDPPKQKVLQIEERAR